MSLFIFCALVLFDSFCEILVLHEKITMYRCASGEHCHCKGKMYMGGVRCGAQVPAQAHDDKYRHAKTQTEVDGELKAQEQIAELLSEIAATLNQKTRLESELVALRGEAARREEADRERRKRTDEEMAKLLGAGQRKDKLISNLQTSHLEEQKALLAQVRTLNSLQLLILN